MRRAAELELFIMGVKVSPAAPLVTAPPVCHADPGEGGKEGGGREEYRGWCIRGMCDVGGWVVDLGKEE